MRLTLEALGVAFALLLFLLAGSVANRSWQTHGAPYQFGSLRGVRTTYRLVAIVVGVAAATSLLGVATLDPVGVAMVPLGAEMCIRSRTIGAKQAGVANWQDRTADFQRGVFAVGAVMVLLAPVVALHL